MKNNSASATTQNNTGHEHHWVTVEDKETIPAVTKIQYQCLGCRKWFDSLNDLTDHAFAVQIGAENGDTTRCGSGSTDAQREVKVEPAKTIVTGTHEECDICHQRR